MKLPKWLRRKPAKSEGAKSWTLTQDEGWVNRGWDAGFWQQDLRGPQGTLNETVEGCISALAQTAAMCPIKHYESDEKGTKTRKYGSNAERVLEKPNPYQMRTEFFNTILRAMYFTGNGIAVATRDDRRAINRLDIVDARSSRGVFDAETGEVYYWVSSLTEGPPIIFNPETDSVFPARDVLHLRLHSGRNPLDGETPITAAARSIAASSALTSHQAEFFNNMARPSGGLFTEEKLNREQMRQLREAVEAQSAKEKSGGLPVFGHGLKFESMALTSQDAQLVEAYGMTVEGIARAFRVPLPVISDLRNSTLNNAEAAMNWFLASGLGYLLEHIELQLKRLFDLPFSENVNCDTKVLLRSDWKSRIETLGEGVLKGIYAPNEARRRAEDGLPDVEFGDEPRVQQQVVPLSAYEDMANEPEPMPVAEPEPEPEPENIEASLQAGLQKGLKHVA